ncbi:hypothetical protein [Amycolatopsis orientalis]|uniref:hypothetical protein n=1 Tax=Amycolatopsis orientalis TaxID=31958 RepID=UPI00056443E0|nr:hypothetical protein [Amycolatopsis orientalis]
MTLPQFPDEPGYWLRRLFEAVDGVSKKLDGHAEELVSHRAELAQHRKEIDELKADDESGRAIRRANVMFALTTLIAIAAVVLQIVKP